MYLSVLLIFRHLSYMIERQLQDERKIYFCVHLSYVLTHRHHFMNNGEKHIKTDKIKDNARLSFLSPRHRRCFLLLHTTLQSPTRLTCWLILSQHAIKIVCPFAFSHFHRAFAIKSSKWSFLFCFFKRENIFCFVLFLGAFGINLNTHQGMETFYGNIFGYVIKENLARKKLFNLFNCLNLSALIDNADNIQKYFIKSFQPSPQIFYGEKCPFVGDYKSLWCENTMNFSVQGYN